VVAGLVGGTFDPGIVMAVLGAALTLFCIGQLFNPYLRRVEDKEWLDELAAARSGVALAKHISPEPKGSPAAADEPEKADRSEDADEPEKVGTPRS
jgi:hypothetical protein